ncbi:MAG: hypothetical protein ASARMPREDX12_004925 [Alectoria sarmentosa]|nr:MAG: hypothetical protein ASARMPREDX12_004925 [Alectoria sarmentosa]
MAADPTKLSYFSLPGEVRNKILDYILVHGEIHPYRPVSETSARIPETTANVERPGIQLMATCKQAYLEGHTLFYSSNTFHLPPTMPFWWSDRLELKHKAMIKRISIQIGLVELTPAMLDEIKSSRLAGVGRKNGPRSGAAVADALTDVWISKLRIEALREAGIVYTQAGYTGMVEMTMDESAWAGLQQLRSRESLPFCVVTHWLISPSDDENVTLKQVDRVIELRENFNADTSPVLRITGIKIICDGVVDACTAALTQAYSSNGVSALHAIGDAAIKNAIDSLENFGTAGRRRRIDHLELTSPEDVKRLGKASITAQPVRLDPAIFRAWPKLLGEARCKRAFACKDFLDGGAVLALGSDAPTAPYAPLSNLYCATTRRSAKEPESLGTTNERYALPLATAMAAATEGTAYSCFADAWTGRLRAGLKADLVVVGLQTL